MGVATDDNSNAVSKPYIGNGYSNRPWDPTIVGRETALPTFRNKTQRSKSTQPFSAPKKNISCID